MVGHMNKLFYVESFLKRSNEIWQNLKIIVLLTFKDKRRKMKWIKLVHLSESARVRYILIFELSEGNGLKSNG